MTDAPASGSSGTIDAGSQEATDVVVRVVDDISASECVPGVPDRDRAAEMGESELGPLRPAVRLLDAHTVNQIAAGEVVERPASVVKELVENALDAGATRILVELVDAGRSKIRVSDDGRGMGVEDAAAALQRHATSKIRSADDLSEVMTLGFRGEALPSIASIARLSLSTCPERGARHVVGAEGGVVTVGQRGSGDRGTDVVVEDLFYNTPARLKFLKTNTTELGACIEQLSRYALGYPHVAIRATHNGHVALETSGSGDLLEAIAEVWGRDTARCLAEIDTVAAGLHVTGFVSPPHLTRPTRAYQYVYVNGRPVRSRTLTAALDQAYRDLTPERRFAVLVLNIEVPPGRVDVNVSPTKSEVKFQSEGQAFDAIRYAIRSSLREHGMMPDANALAAVAFVNEAMGGVAPLADYRTGNASSDAPSLTTLFAGRQVGSLGEAPAEREARAAGFAERAIDAQSPISGLSSRDLAAGAQGAPFTQVGRADHFERGGLWEASAGQSPTEARTALGGDPAAVLHESRYPFSALLDGLRVLGQAFDTFIVAQTRRGIAIIDQHVAHERVLYEYLCGLKGSSPIERQPLLHPETLQLDRRSAVLIRERLDELRAVGYDMEPFGGESLLVRAAPAALRGKDPMRVLKDLVDELVDSTVVRKLVPTREQIWITSSCKMAVKSGDPLSIPEMEKLIFDLAETENPYMCPHGRPITINLSIEELLRKFKRT